MRRRLLRLLRLPERPDPPPGSEPTLRVFRASRRLFQLKVVGWALRQALALAGILLSFAILEAIERTGGPPQWLLDTFLAAVPPEGREVQERLFAVSLWVLPWARLLEWVALGIFAINLVWTWQLLHLDWEARWYMVSDESLRIREGLWRTHERTMTVANIQNLAVRQGPLQKLLGIADLEVRTAGGGASAKPRQPGREHDDLHTGRFRGVDDAEGLRDRIQAAMLRHRGSGLGDPEEPGAGELTAHAVPSPSRSSSSAELAAACDALVREARALRAAAEARAAR